MQYFCFLTFKSADDLPLVKPRNRFSVLYGVGNGCTKQDHIVTVGGPGNSLDRNYHYSIEKDLSFIADRLNNMKVKGKVPRWGPSALQPMAYCTLTPKEFLHSSLEALHIKRCERPQLAKEGTIDGIYLTT
jgi:hypothetical protein